MVLFRSVCCTFKIKLVGTESQLVQACAKKNLNTAFFNSNKTKQPNEKILNNINYQILSFRLHQIVVASHKSHAICNLSYSAWCQSTYDIEVLWSAYLSSWVSVVRTQHKCRLFSRQPALFVLQRKLVREIGFFNILYSWRQNKRLSPTDRNF